MADKTASNKAESFASRLYNGHISWDFIGHRRWWYAFSGLVMLVGIVSLAIRGLNPSIDFKGGAQFEGPLNDKSITQLTDIVSSNGVNPEKSLITGTGSGRRFEIQTKVIPNATTEKIEAALAKEVGVTQDKLSTSTVGSTWGGQITNKAIEGLIIFLVAVIAYLSIRFEWKMALAAIIALIHDLIITAGIYSLSGLEVSPSTVIAVLTILGYSLYDTVVVFDKVRENTDGIAGGSRMTFTQASNLAVNQTLVRSINTSIIALLPVIGLLVIGAGFLGAGSLDDLSLALLIGLASGAYSSIFIATPILCDLKEREPTYQALAKRVAARRSKDPVGSVLEPAVATVPAQGFASDSADGVGEFEDAARPASSAARTRAPASQRRQATRGGRPGGRGGKPRKRR